MDNSSESLGDNTEEQKAPQNVIILYPISEEEMEKCEKQFIEETVAHLHETINAQRKLPKPPSVNGEGNVSIDFDRLKPSMNWARYLYLEEFGLMEKTGW